MLQVQPEAELEKRHIKPKFKSERKVNMVKVIDNALRNIRFGDLALGATFKHKDEYYIKTIFVREGYNAVDLENGTMYCFTDADIVIPFNCELIVL